MPDSRSQEVADKVQLGLGCGRDASETKVLEVMLYICITQHSSVKCLNLSTMGFFQKLIIVLVQLVQGQPIHIPPFLCWTDCSFTKRYRICTRYHCLFLSTKSDIWYLVDQTTHYSHRTCEACKIFVGSQARDSGFHPFCFFCALGILG